MAPIGILCLGGWFTSKLFSYSLRIQNPNLTPDIFIPGWNLWTRLLEASTYCSSYGNWSVATNPCLLHLSWKQTLTAYSTQQWQEVIVWNILRNTNFITNGGYLKFGTLVFKAIFWEIFVWKLFFYCGLTYPFKRITKSMYFMSCVQSHMYTADAKG